MGKKSRPFLAKASSRTYKVVYRPREEGSATGKDENAGVYSLTRSGAEVQSDEVLAYRPAEVFEDDQYRRADFENGELGLPDDGYNYDQHLKAIGNQTGLAGSVVFLQRKEPLEEEPIPLTSYNETLEQARKEDDDLDEVMRMLEEDEDEDEDGSEAEDFTGETPQGFAPGVLEDNFLSIALGATAAPVLNESAELDDVEEAEPERDVRLLDEQFEKLLREDYEDDDNDSYSEPDSNSVQHEPSGKEVEAWGQFIRQDAPTKVVRTDENPLEVTTQKRFLLSVEDEGAADLERFDEADSDDDDWDCQSVLTTYTNLENHPTVIGAPQRQRRILLDNRLNAPADYLPKRPNEDPLSEVNTVAVPMPAPRQRGETNEDKRARKRMVKEQRQQRREEKSNMKRAFKDENLRQSTAQVAMGEIKVAVQFSS